MYIRQGTLGGLCAALLLTASVLVRADTCITLKPARETTRISVTQDEDGVAIRVVGAANVSGDTDKYSVSAFEGMVVWRAANVPDAAVSTSRGGGVVKVCQSAVGEAASAQPSGAGAQAPLSGGATNVTGGSTTAKSGDAASAAAPTGAGQNAAKKNSTTANAGAKSAAVTPAPTTGAASKTATQEINDPEKVVVAGVSAALKGGALEDAQDRFAHDFAPYVLYLAKPTISRRILSDAEEKRIDQQVGSTQPSTGTSVASKGSVPWLMGFAAESGAITQTSSNNVMTFNASPANLIKAMKAKDYLASYSVGAHDTLVKMVTPLSFSVSFNVAQSSNSSGTSGGAIRAFDPAPATSTTGAKGTFAGASARYSYWNHRDARDQRYQTMWADFVNRNAQPMLAAVSRLVESLGEDPKYRDAFEKWQVDTQAAITRTDMTPEEIGKAFEQRAEALRMIVGNNAVLQTLVDDAAQSIETYAKLRNDILNRITNSMAHAFEYTETQQSNLLGGPVTVTNFNPGGRTSIPNLSTFNFIMEKGSSSLGGSQFTANASTTIFNSIPIGTRIGRVRDYRAAVQTDIPLPEIPSVGMPIITFSGLFLSLLNQPLGQTVVVNDVPVSLKGNIWLFQSKLSLKVKDSGIKIPVALTYANRTELNKASDVRGSIGVTYNLDNLFASSGK